MVILENKWLHIEIDTWKGAFTKFINRTADIPLISKGFKPDLPPWLLLLQESPTGPIRVINNFESCDVVNSGRGNSVDFLWKIKDGLQIKAKLYLDGDTPDAMIVCNVENKTDEIVTAIEFPVIYGIGTLGGDADNTCLAHPVSGGFLFRAPFKTFLDAPRLRHIPYPNGFGAPMQFFAYYVKDSGGFCFACHDPHDTAKEFNFFRDGKGLVASILHESWDLKKGNNLRLGYPVIISAFEKGDWYTPANRYRNWATGKGKGCPGWCKAGRLEDRVKKGKAAKWLSEETGLCTFGMPSSSDVSGWIDAFHKIAGAPVFHVLGYDWAGWADLKEGLVRSLHEVLKSLDLPPCYNTFLRLHEAFKDLSADDVENGNKLRSAMHKAGLDVKAASTEDLQDAFRAYLRHKSELGENDGPAKWFPARFHPKNLEAIKRNGDYFAPFLFDFFSYGHSLDKYGILSPEMRERHTIEFMDNWIHPATKLWQDFHTLRDARVVEQYGADANYYDVSASNIGNFSDRNDLGCPAGKGRCLTDAYRKIYGQSRKATGKSKGKYVPRGTEVMIENFIGVIDFAQCRAGGELQGDMEGRQFLDWQKSGKARRIPMWAYVYHEYGPVRLDGWCKLSREFGAYFFYIASRVCLEGSLLELNYEFSSLELFPGMKSNSLHLSYDRTIIIDEKPYGIDPEKLEFLKEITAARTQFAKKYLCYGKMVQPLKITPAIPFTELDWYHYNDINGHREGGVENVPAVIHEAWLYKGISLGALFVNLLKRPQMVVVDINLGYYDIPGGPWKLYLTTRGEKPKLLGEMREIQSKIRLSLDSRKIYLLEIK